MKKEEHDELWVLLGKAREPRVPPFFASKVVRAAQAADEPAPGLFAWLRRRWMVPLTAGAAVALIAFFVIPRPAKQMAPIAGTPDPLEEMASVASISPEVASLDALLASDEHSIWLAADFTSLF